MAQIIQFAVAGDLIEVEVPYYKKIYLASTHHSQKLMMDYRDHQMSLIEMVASAYNSAYMHVSSNERLYKSAVRALRQRMDDLRRTKKDKTNAIPGRSVLDLFQKTVSSFKKVAVLGGGIQGTVMALLFRKHGYDVTVIVKSTDLLNRASNNQEGKIHLGMVYSKDETMKTGERMMESALRFSSYMEYLLEEEIDWKTWKSTKFHYMVPYDSLLSPNELEIFFAKLEETYHRFLREDPSLSYLGERPEHLYRRISLPQNINSTFFEGAFESEEYAISQAQFKDSVKRKLRSTGVHILLNTVVQGVTRNNNTEEGKKFLVRTDKGEYNIDLVVNCLWEGRRPIDKQLGLSQWSGENIRLKFGIKAGWSDELAAMPSMTIVNGPFGDYVNYPNDNKMYFSWYPTSCAQNGMLVNQDIPPEWERIVEGSIPEELAKNQIKAQQAKFGELLLPGVEFSFKEPKVVGGFILGNGDKDVQHVDSKLHVRADDPIRYDDGYWSISTQKFTSAPYHAYLLEKEYLSAFALKQT